MIFSSIKSRILSLAIIPVAAASLIFFSYFVNKQNNLIEKALTDKGNDVAQHLAVASEYAIFSGNLSFLSPQVDAALAQSSIVSITIMDDRGIALIQKYNDSFTAELQENSTTSTSNNRIFNRPVIQSSLNISDFDELERTQTAIIGWVIVELSNHLAEQQKRQSTIETLLITLAILISSIYLATRISSRIATPITTLTNAVREIEHGNLEVSVNTHSSGELLSLEQGVKGMLRSIKFSHQDAHQKIKQATLELRESYELLENKNYDLTIARQAALSASQAKSFFLANISHEIRTPMNGILGFVRLLKSSPLSKEQLDHLHTIEQSSHNLLHIINDVLDLSRIEAGKILIKNTRFNLRESIEEVEILMSPSANEKGLEITDLFYDDTPEVIIGPQDRIRQVLINLLGNAIKFSDHGTITIRAMIESRNNETTTIKLSVSDQGPGISKKGQELLFNTFTQLDESDTRQHGGAGLGLSISKSLAKAMNGDIGVESQLNEGSTFWFTFECTLPKNPDIFIQEQKAFSGKTAAIYDANNISRQNLSHTFRKIGFFVKEYTSIEELNN
ncbi:MAG: ATP-binding protein, partial [Anaerolineales bacterium]